MSELPRRLSAILATDVVGYSALMEKDETGTFQRLRNRRKELFEPKIRSFRGQIFHLAGDGLLAEFASVVDAVQCAILLQKEMARLNLLVAHDHRFDVRIAVNVGDVIIAGKDRHGDGVNVASRLQALAERGGIVISGTAHDNLISKARLSLNFAGEFKLHNIERLVRVYHVNFSGVPPSRLRLTTAAIGSRSKRNVLIAAASVIALSIGVGGYKAWLAPPLVLALTGYVGGSKANLLDAPEVKRLLRDKYGIEIEYKTLGGLEQVSKIPPPYDFLWPGTELAVEGLQGGAWPSKIRLPAPVPDCNLLMGTVGRGTEPSWLCKKGGRWRILLRDANSCADAAGTQDPLA